MVQVCGGIGWTGSGRFGQARTWTSSGRFTRNLVRTCPNLPEPVPAEPNCGQVLGLCEPARTCPNLPEPVRAKPNCGQIPGSVVSAFRRLEDGPLFSFATPSCNREVGTPYISRRTLSPGKRNSFSTALTMESETQTATPAAEDSSAIANETMLIPTRDQRARLRP